MKIRTGFVSNSSSSSFCAYGLFLGKDEFEDRIQKLGYKFKDSEDRGEVVGPDGTEYDSIQEVLDATFGGCVAWEEEWVIIGKTPSEIEDNETGKQFKERVAKEIAPLIEGEEKCSWHCEDYYS
jgi:hypothetical protein